jgi:hypothetical protein
MLMTLENTLLEKLSEWQPAPGRQELSVGDPDAGWSVTLTADRSDMLGCLLWELSLHCGAGVADLAGWAGRAAERVSGLMEPLKVIEVDNDRRQAQLRSESPLQRADKCFYYELLLQSGGSAVLRRFQAGTTTTHREQVTFALTHEVLAKLASDVAAASVVA